MKLLEEYKTLVFDCDGVILNSNPLKTEAFYRAAAPYGEAAARALVAYHVLNGGISRYAKFEHFLCEIVSPGAEGPDLGALLASFANHVRAGLLSCELARGLDALRESTRDARWLLVSGGDQEELHEVFRARQIETYFDGGIFGSPDSKRVIVEREMARENILRPAVFLGDSKVDRHVAQAFGLDFVFVSAWTEVDQWERYVDENGLYAVPSLARLIE